MANEGTTDRERALRWQFWFVVAFSLLLIITFVYYLPLRFQHHISVDEREEIMAMHGEGEAHGGAVFHEEGEVREGLAVNMNVTPVPVRANGTIKFDFFVNEKPSGRAVPASELEIEHTKLMHVIGVRDDMNGFFHVHPRPSSETGVFTISGMLSQPGRYKLWSEVKKDGLIHAFGHPEIDVQGDGARSEKQVSFRRNVIVGDYQVALALEEPVPARQEHDLSFDVHTLTGGEVAVEPYLDADMHLTLIKDDWKEFIHTHPEGDGHHASGSGLIRTAQAHGDEGPVPTGADETINFHVMFPEPGLYKAFAQFRPAGSGLGPDDALLAEFWIEVKEALPLAFLNWWTKLLASLALIGIVSWVAYEYLKGGSRKESSAAHE